MRRKILNLIRLTIFTILSEKMMIRLVRGKEYGSFLTKLIPNHDQFSSPTLKIAPRNEVNFHLDISDMVDWYIYFGFYDSAKERFLSSLSEGDVVIDVGANVGEITLRSNSIVGPSGEVHSFEPDANNYKRLSKNIELNQPNQIVYSQFAVGSEIGEVSLERVEEHNLGTTRVNTTTQDQSTIPMTTIDNYVEGLNTDKLDAIKVDVEGYEYFVLIGAIQAIEKYKPILYFELDDENLKNFNSSPKELVQKIEGLSYQIFDARDESILNSEMDFTGCHLDIIARPL